MPGKISAHDSELQGPGHVALLRGPPGRGIPGIRRSGCTLPDPSRQRGGPRRPCDLAALPGNRLGSLRGDRAGQHSIRINAQWRICFRWTEEGPCDVEIVLPPRGDDDERGERDAAGASG